MRVARTITAGQPRIRLTIADNGSGIRSPELKRIFEPFFTTKDSVGTGLGLWITKEIIGSFGGSVRVRSKPGHGTVFSVSLPAMEPGANAGTACVPAFARAG